MARRHTPNRRDSEDYNTRMAQHTAPKKQRKERNFAIDLIVITIFVVVAYIIFEPMFNQDTQATQGKVNPSGEYEEVDYPIISEVMSANRDAIASSDGNYYDWVEVYNPTEMTINLQGYTLSDSESNPSRYVFPSVALEPGEFQLVYMSGGALEEDFHADFKISSSGETLYLFDAHSNIKDSIEVGHLSPNTSYAVNLAILDNWEVTEYYTPGFYNDETGWTSFLATRVIYGDPLQINEVMPSNLITITDCDDEYSDWVEIINSGTATLDISGYALSDSTTSTRDWIFPNDTILAPGELLVVFLSGKDKVDEKTGELHAGFRLNSTEDTLVLSNIEGKILDQWLVTDLNTDQSMGRQYGDESTIIVFSHPTPGYVNTEDGYNDFQKEQDLEAPSGLTISEVMIGNTDTLVDESGESPDWIELHNSTTEKIMLGNFYLSDDASDIQKWRFPEGFFIGPDEYMVVYASGLGEAENGVPNTNFSLDALGEPVILSNGEGVIVDTCVLASMPYDVSYGRTGIDNTYQYMLYATPGEENGLGWSGFALDPIFEQEGGIYAEGQIIALNVPEGTKVYYTTDCSEPTENSQLYQGPFQIYETTVVRARAYEDEKLPSSLITTTYFVEVEHELPIVSITSDPVNLFSKTSGIYAYGDDFDKSRIPFSGANFNEDWEVEAYLEMYEIDGSQAINQGIGLRIFGAFSRGELKKSFTLVARSQYGASTIQYPIFSALPYEEYKSVILREGASEWYSSMIRDTLLTSLAGDYTDLDVQAYYPVVVYLNGEYWGVYFFREKLNKYYVEQHYGYPADEIDIIYGNGTSSRHAVSGDNENWLELRDYVKSHDLSDPVAYQTVVDWVDIDNYMDMVINEIYVGNQDSGNIKCYRYDVEGQKWRWFYYDVDWAFFYTDSANKFTNNFTKYLNDTGHGAGSAFETWLIMGLLENDEFKQLFIERFAYHINVTYNPDRVVERIEEIYALLDPEMPQDREHWNNEWKESPVWYREVASRSMSYESWSSTQKERLIDFANQRPTIMQQYLVEFFDIDPEMEAQLFPN